MDIWSAIRVLEEIYGGFDDKDAVSAGELEDAERRLGVRLPDALRSLYSRTGRSGPLHHSYNTLVSPSDLQVEREHLVFYVESQGACVWGIPFDQIEVEDPPVHTSYCDKSGAVQWKEQFLSVTEFICIQGAWQAIEGGVPVVGLVSRIAIAGQPSTNDSHLGKRAEDGARTVGRQIVDSAATRAWLIRGCVFAMASYDYFGLAGRDPEQFAIASQDLGVCAGDWSYSSLRDG